MTKPQYNQGDLLRWHRERTAKVREGGPHLLVITDVFTRGKGKFTDTYYAFTWIEDGSENTYQIKTLDGDPNFKLLIRGRR
jgi:hypothetical protein